MVIQSLGLWTCYDSQILLPVRPSIAYGLTYTLASCTRNVRILPDTTHLPTSPSHDILILPGGAPGAKTFATNSAVQSLIRAYRDESRWTAFICAATTALTASVAGSTSSDLDTQSATKCRVTSHPSFKDEVVKAGWEYADDQERVVVVEEQKIVTSRGPGTAMEFALAIVECLAGKDKRVEVTGPLVMMPANL